MNKQVNLKANPGKALRSQNSRIHNHARSQQQRNQARKGR